MNSRTTSQHFREIRSVLRGVQQRTDRVRGACQSRSRLTLLVGILLILSGQFVGCATVPTEPPAPSSTQKALVGKTKAELLSCATVRPDEKTVGTMTVLKYYKEASLLEESFPGTKSSFPRTHHGCWAILRLTNDVVTEVEYRSVPKDYVDDDHCDEIFAPCVGQ